MASVGAVAVEQQHEKLRRFVDEWRASVLLKLEQHDDVFLRVAASDVGDVNRDPVHLTAQPLEEASVLDLAVTDNVPFTKLVTVLAFDCLEIQSLRKQAVGSIYPWLVGFGLGASLEELPLEGELQISFAKSFLFFHELLAFLSRLRAVLRNLVLQLDGIYGGDRGKSFSSFGAVHLLTAVVALAEGLGVLVTIDHIVAQNGALGHSLSLFTRMLHEIRSDPSKFDMEPENVELLDRAVIRIDDTLTTGSFHRCLQEDFNSGDLVKVKTNRQFLDEVSLCLKEAVLQVLPRLDTLRERPSDREQIGWLLALFVFHAWSTVDAPDKKLCKLIFEVQRTIPVLHLFCNIRMVPPDFLVTQLPPGAFSSSILRELRKEAGLLNSRYLLSLDDMLLRDVQSSRSAITNWLVSFDSAVSTKVLQVAVQAVLGMRLKQLAQGIFLANRLRNMLRACVDLHVFMEVPIRKDQIRVLHHAAELLKAVEDMYHRKNSETVQSIGHMIQLTQAQILRHLIHVKAQLEADTTSKARSSGLNLFTRSMTRSAKEIDAKLLDALAAVGLAINILQGCCSGQRRILFRMCLDILSSHNRLPDNLYKELSDLFLLIEMAAELHQLVRTVTDCSFLYWSREMMSTCFGMVYGQAEEARHLQFLINSFTDGVKLLKRAKVDESVIKAFEKEIEVSVTEEIISPLCRDIETDLRLHVHSAHLKGTVAVNPTKTGVRDLSWFLQLKPLRFSSKYIHIKARVESYLNSAFYDHAAVALHDWKTYGEMRQLSEQKYKLELDDIHLPSQTLEQGVDLLDIMRNIHLFVACYTYNLNTQVFFERPSNALHRKHINTVSVRHVANSIRTHGTGIMSTTVNIAYQYLAQKFVVFSQFLYDDHIKSCLGKERRFYKETGEKHAKQYPFTRAEKLNKDIRKLGMTEDRLSFLDQFRQLIAEMGNALGFVRMVRHGGLHYCSIASGFVQGVNHSMSFEESSRDYGLSEETIEAGRLLDRALESQDLSLERTNYLNILANVFSKELRSEDNMHLREFFLIVPALIINSVEAMLQAKDKLYKRGREAVDAMFTDDGFALGLAYVLKVLGQDKQFDSLHWFDSSRQHLIAEKSRMEDGLDMNSTRGGMSALEVWSQKLASISVEQAQNMQLIIKRLETYLTEFELMEFTFSGARIFFQ